MDMINLTNKLSKLDIAEIIKSPKTAHNCFLASIHALGRSDFGSNILRNNILKNSPDEYIIRYANIKNKEEFFSITTENHTKYPTFMRYKSYICKKLNPMHAVEISWDKVVKKFPSLKSVISRLVHFSDSAGEWNLASNFMKHFTGRSPISIGDKSIFPLLLHQKKVHRLLNRLEKLTNKDYSFVAGTGLENNLTKFYQLPTMHYYSIKKVTASDIFLSDVSRPTEEIRFSRKEFIQGFRSICGYFPENFTLK